MPPHPGHARDYLTRTLQLSRKVCELLCGESIFKFDMKNSSEYAKIYFERNDFWHPSEFWFWALYSAI